MPARSELPLPAVIVNERAWLNGSTADVEILPSFDDWFGWTTTTDAPW